MDVSAESQPQTPDSGGTSVSVTDGHEPEHPSAAFAMLPDLQFRTENFTLQPADVEGGNAGVTITTFRGAIGGAIRGAASATLSNLEESHESAAAAAARYRCVSHTAVLVLPHRGICQWK